MAAAAGGGQHPVSLLVPSYSDGTKGRWEKIISDFQAANPDVQVALEVQSWDNINDVVRTKVQANQAPDILNIDAYSGFAQDDLLYPADEIVSPETIADLQPSFVQNATLDGTQQALPLIASTRTLFYNTDLFSQGRDRRAAQDVGRAAGRRGEDPGARAARHLRLRHAAGQRGGPGRDVHLDLRRRRQLG